ncbi:hypothetical protein T01_10670 [Trichinella spiralis]|uniref:Uncharacterized protein n=1 Tax=Trichinella spiralis TaxID=6334 RepID=A0A0V1BUZ9_TRISP|nr:hypothetical protein T01_10670 [Trichinella spiralis]
MVFTLLKQMCITIIEQLMLQTTLHHKNCAFIVCKFLQFIDLINFLGYFPIYNLTLNSYVIFLAV